MELKKRGRYYWVIYYDLDRVRHRQSTKQTTLKEAQRVGRELERAAQTASSPEANRTVREVAQLWLARGTPGIRPQTRRRYDFAARHLAEHLGDDLVHRLTKTRVREYQTIRVGERAKRGTIRSELQVLRQVLRYARESGWTRTLPDDVMPPWKDAYQPRKRWLTYDEVVKVAGALRPERAFWCWVSVYTSARASEVHSLRWSDLDVGARRLHIRGTKSAGSDRWVAVPQPLWDMLMARPAHQPEDPIVKRWEAPDRSKTLARVCKKLGLAHLTAHDLRRTFGSWLAQKGASILVVAKLMGHDDSRITEKTYSHLAQEHLDQAMHQLDTVKDTASGTLYEDAKEP